MKKRCFVLFLIVAMMFAGCANTGSSKEEVSGTVQTTATESALMEKPVSMGRIEGGSYINEYAGFACNLDSSWEFYSAEELQEFPEAAKKALEGSELGDNIDTMNQFTDMLAENVDDMVSINVLYQKHSMQERLSFAMLTEEEILDTVLEQQDMLVEAYNQAGFEVESIEKVKVSFLGEERMAIRSAMTIQGIPYYLLQIMDYHRGRYSVTLSLISFVEDNTESLLELFYKVG